MFAFIRLYLNSYQFSFHLFRSRKYIFISILIEHTADFVSITIYGGLRQTEVIKIY